MKTHTEHIESADHAYTIHIGGTLDGVNTRDPVGYSAYNQTYEPNHSVRLENTGDTNLVNPWIIVNNKRDWRSIHHILANIIEDKMPDAEKARAIWEFACKHRYHYTCADDEVKDTVKMLNCYGYTLCWDEAYTVANLWQAAGLKVRRGYPHGHCTTEVYYDGAYHLLDSDEHLLYLLRDNKTIASEEDLSRDHDLVKRGHAYGILQPENRKHSEGAASLFFHTGPRSGDRPQLTTHTMDFTLRPHEALIWCWEDRNKYHGFWDRPKRLSNGQIHYTPDLTQFEKWATNTAGWTSIPNGLKSKQSNAYLELEIHSPYVIVGGKIHLTSQRNNSESKLSIDLSRNDHDWHTIWTSESTGDHKTTIDLDPHFPSNTPASYTYRLRLQSHSDNIFLKNLAIETDLQMAPLSLPALEIGDNTIHFTADTEGQAHITHKWTECEADPPLQPPEKPNFPANNDHVSGTQFTFSWPEVAGATDYHFQLSDRPDFKYLLSPVFDKLISKTPAWDNAQWHIPCEGLLNPNQTYYWRIRPRNRDGLWGHWSPIWSFTLEAPGIPLAVEIEANWDTRSLTLHWQPNAEGNSPDHYEIYGSNERGFTASDKPYEVVTGKQETETFPANLINTSKQTSTQIAGSAIKNGNFAFYRVVAIDANGVRSGPSDVVEAPRPMIVSKPSNQAIAGQTYTYQIKTIASIGELRSESKDSKRYVSAFRDGDTLRYLIDEGPGFIELDEHTGLLTAYPQLENASTHTVTIRVQNGQGGTDMQGFDLQVIPHSDK